MKRILAILVAVLSLAAAADPSERLSDPVLEARARAVFSEVRCLVCQNESIDDSTADLAADLRKLVREEIKVGRTDAQVKAYLVSRYGEFGFAPADLVSGQRRPLGGADRGDCPGVCLVSFDFAQACGRN